MPKQSVKQSVKQQTKVIVNVGEGKRKRTRRVKKKIEKQNLKAISSFQPPQGVAIYPSAPPVPRSSDGLTIAKLLLDRQQAINNASSVGTNGNTTSTWQPDYKKIAAEIQPYLPINYTTTNTELGVTGISENQLQQIDEKGFEVEMKEPYVEFVSQLDKKFPIKDKPTSPIMPMRIDFERMATLPALPPTEKRTPRDPYAVYPSSYQNEKARQFLEKNRKARGIEAFKDLTK